MSNVGLSAGLVAFISIITFSLVQLLQIAGVLRFPADETLFYGTSLFVVVPFILEMLDLHHLTPSGMQFWTHAALVFTNIYAVFWNHLRIHSSSPV